ncbi:MAG: TonB-dependent receptor, partial [Acidobacteria bacterium]|nr:TonB-dependent receptor [Acidobacteriota bacterium]
NFPKELTQGPVATTSSNTAGDGLASMLLGLGNGTLTRGNKSQTTRNPYYGFYFADDWKITPRLTLNLGLRYDLELPRVELYNRMTKFDPTMTSPLAGPAGLPNLKGGIVFVGVNGLPRTQSATDSNNFAPRVGLAYQLSKRMAVRTAYGIFFAPSLMAATGDVSNYGFRSDTPYIGGRDGDPIFPANYLRDPFPNGFLKAVGPSLGALTGIGDTVASYIGNSLTPYTQNWNFSIQYELPRGVLIESSYVVARGLKLNESSSSDYNLNQLRPEQMALGNAFLTSRVPNPFLGQISPIFSLGAATIRQMDLIRAFPQYGSMAQMYRIGASSWYHSYQLRVEKRFRGGLGALISYTNGKQIDDHSAISIVGNDLNHQNIYDRKSDRSISPNDVSQRLVMSWVAELPLGRGRWMGKSMNRWLDGVVGGWQFNGIMSMQRGQPFTILGSQNPNFGSASLRANNNGKSAALSGDVKARLTRYFDTSVFSQPAPFTFGNVGRTLPDVRVPGMQNFDLSLFKNFKVYEKQSLQFRLEAFNALNRAQFGAPIPGVNNGSFGWIFGTANTPRQLQLGLKYLF